MKKMTEAFFAFIKANKALIICFSFVFILGVISGSYFLGFLPESGSLHIKNNLDIFFSVYKIQAVSPEEVFKSILKQNMLSFVYLWLSGMFLFLIPVAFLQIFIKGIRLGFSIGYFYTMYSGRGLLFSVMELTFANVILLPLMILYAVYCVRFSKNLYRMKNFHSRVSKTKMYASSFLCLIFVFLAVVCASFLNSYVLLCLMKLV